MRKGHSRIYLTVVLFSLVLVGAANVFGSWGVEVGRASATDVIRKQKDWLSFKQGRDAINRATAEKLTIDRYRVLAGRPSEVDRMLLYEEVQNFWFDNLFAPLQMITLNPAASCAEARHAFTIMVEQRKQKQGWGLEDNELFMRIYFAIEKATQVRCRDEALDECMATGRFKQIIDLMIGSQRQMHLLGGEGDEEEWAERALKQCAIYELHFTSRTTTRDSGLAGPVEVETVRDGRIPIKFKVPPGGLGLKESVQKLGDLLNGKTENNPFFVSVKCKAPQPLGVPKIDFICSPGADSSKIEVRISALNFKHKEFYVEPEKAKYMFAEEEISRERYTDEKDELSFTFEGGEFNLQGLIKVERETVDIPMPNIGIGFYMAHKKDQVAPNKLSIDSSKRGVYPAIFKFTYPGIGDTDESGILSTDTTEFELIHKPNRQPFEKPPEPIRRPLKPPSNN